MDSKDIIIMMVSIIALIELIIIVLLLPVKTIEEVKDNNVNQQWQNITTWRDE